MWAGFSSICSGFSKGWEIYREIIAWLVFIDCMAWKSGWFCGFLEVLRGLTAWARYVIGGGFLAFCCGFLGCGVGFHGLIMGSQNGARGNLVVCGCEILDFRHWTQMI